METTTVRIPAGTKLVVEAPRDRPKPPKMTRAEWDLLAAAEAPYYTPHCGLFAFTDVMPYGEGDEWLSEIWQHTDYCLDAVEEEYGPRGTLGRDEEVARRVAHALTVLSFGIEYAAEGRERAEAER